MPSSSSSVRCPWCKEDDSLYVSYHDLEWGVPIHDGRKLFEMLNLEGAQAGLSWRTILGKRTRYKEIFDDFVPSKLAKWSDKKIEKALTDPGIVRNRLKVRGVIRNARAVEKHFDGNLETFSTFLWSFTGGKPIQNRFTKLSEILPKTSVSDQMSKELKKRDFTFVGSTICYAFMQAVGMTNDHLTTCFRYKEVRKSSPR